MAKRFRDTTKFDHEWYMKLRPRLKCAVDFILDKCDSAGVWLINMTTLNVGVNDEKEISLQEILQVDAGKQFLEFEPGKIFCIDFIQFQYGTLSEKCKPHIPIINLLKKYNLQNPLSKGYPKGIDTLKEKETDKEMETDYLEKSEKPLEDSDDEKLKQYDEWALLIREGRDPFFETELYNSKIDVAEVTSDRIGLFIGLLNTYPKKRPSSQQAFRKSLLAFIIEQKAKKINGTTSKFLPPPTSTVYKKPERISEPLQDLTKIDPAKSDWSAMIQSDIEKTLAGANFLPRIGGMKIDWLVKRGKYKITIEKFAEYKIIAQDEFIQQLMNSMEEISNRVTLDYFKTNGTWQETEQAKIIVIAKELAYRDYLNSHLPKYTEQPAEENIV